MGVPNSGNRMDRKPLFRPTPMDRTRSASGSLEQLSLLAGTARPDQIAEMLMNSGLLDDGTGLTVAARGGLFEPLDHLDQVKNPDIPIFDPGNPYGDESDRYRGDGHHRRCHRRLHDLPVGDGASPIPEHSVGLRYGRGRLAASPGNFSRAAVAVRRSSPAEHRSDARGPRLRSQSACSSRSSPARSCFSGGGWSPAHRSAWFRHGSVSLAIWYGGAAKALERVDLLQFSLLRGPGPG